MASKTKPKVKRKTRRKRYIAGRDGPRPVDVYVGRRVKTLRVLRGMSQEELGKRVGLTFQQIQKYERGANRMGASRLWEFSSILGIPVEWFFEGVEGRSKPNDPLQTKRETLVLVRAFSACSDDIQDRLKALFQALAKPNSARSDP